MPRKNPRSLDGIATTPDPEQNQPISGKVHNAAAREDIQRECRAGFRGIMAKRAELNEEAGELRKRLRDAGINVEGFMFALKVGEREQDDRDAFMDGLRESFQAMGIGEQGSFLTAIAAVGGTVHVGAKELDPDDPRPDWLKNKTASAPAAGNA